MQHVTIDISEAVGLDASRKQAAVDELIMLGRVTAALELQAAKAARARGGAVLLPVEAVGQVREVVISSGRTMRDIKQRQSRMLADDLDELECHLGPVTAKLCKMAIWACVAAGPLAAVW